MKISVLLPTRERLTLLRSAVDSVLRLDDGDFELVISDNASAEDIAGYVESLHDSRIVFTRTESAVPVTDNWNNALAHSSGDYMVMLGDDDALLTGYFSRLRKLIADFDRPQVVYHNALVYAYPGVVPEEPEGFLRSEGYAEFLRGVREPFRLEPTRAALAAHAAMGFRLRLGFNMQFAAISRSIVEDLSADGPFFRSPFPDYYAMSHLFLRARSIVVDPRPAVVIGVSPRSYGFFHNNRQEAAGRAFLEADRAAPQAHACDPLIPGTNINDGWLEAMRELHGELGHPAHPRPDYARYRRLQILYVYDSHFLRGSIDETELGELRLHMSRRERLIFDTVFKTLARLAHNPRARATIPLVLALVQRQFPPWDPIRDEARYADIDEVVARVDPDEDPARWQRPRKTGLISGLVRRLG